MFIEIVDILNDKREIWGYANKYHGINYHCYYRIDFQKTSEEYHLPLWWNMIYLLFQSCRTVSELKHVSKTMFSKLWSGIF